MHKESAKTLIKNEIYAAIQIIFGVLFVAFWGSAAIVEGVSTENSFGTPMVIVCVAFTALGAYLIISGSKRRKIIILFKDYSEKLAADSLHSIDRLAISTNLPVETVKKNLQIMINKGYFTGVSLDFDRNCLVCEKGKLEFSSIQPNN